MKQGDGLFWIWLSEALGAGNRDFRVLISMYENPYDLFHAEESELERLEISPRTKKVLADKDLKHASEVLDLCERQGIGILTYADTAYPKALRDLNDPPVLLYYLGKIPDFDAHLSIGTVGTRRMSAYGLQTAYKISYELASVGAIVVSGMASGIDGVCAAGAIAAGGVTVAVLGCGLDIVYPRHHEKLRDQILENGVVFSEYPPGTRPNSYHFPVRNRIISGISQGTLVVEAGLGSGSLITARNAIVQGRDVFAVPANVGSSGSEGTNGLLRDGANLVLGTDDILDRYRYLYADALHMEKLPDAKKRSAADLHFLDRLSVIELTPAGESRPAEDRAPKPETPAKKRNPSRKPAAKPDEPRKETAENKPQSDAAPSTPAQTPDAVLAALTPVQRAVLEAIPDDHPVSVDSMGGLGYPYGEMIAALTMLEILGLIRKLPGALYSKC